MALLIIGLDKVIGSAQAWRDTFAAQLPALEVRVCEGFRTPAH